METTESKWTHLEQASLTIEQSAKPRKRVLCVPQHIQRKFVLILCTIIGIIFVVFIALLSLNFKNMSKEGTEASLQAEANQAESKKQLMNLQEFQAALMANRNLTASILKELAVMKMENGRISKDVMQARKELQSFTVAVMAKGNSTASLVEELAAIKTENSGIAKDLTKLKTDLESFTVSLMADQARSSSVIEELAALKRTNGKIANDVVQLLGKWNRFTVKQSWHSAQRSCENEGAHLVIINSLVEQNTLVKQLANEQTLWIGLSDSTTEGSWRWLDGTALSLSFWGSGEPNDAAHEGEDCATLIYNGKWNDAACSKSEHWICEKKC